MAIEVELPDGNIVEFPDGTDNATMERALQQYAAPKANFGNVRGGSRSTESARTRAPAAGLAPSRTADAQPLPPSLESINAQQRQTMGSGQGQFLQMQQDASQRQQQRDRYQSLPAPVRAAYGASKIVPDTGMAALQMLSGGAEDWEAQRREEGQFAAGDGATQVGQVVGQVGATAVPLARIGSLGRGAQYLASAGVGAASGAFQPVVGGESRAINTAAGGALGALGQGASNAVMASGRAAANAVSPQLRQIYEAAKARGISLSPAQLSDSRFLKFLDSQLRSVPFSGAEARAASQRAQWNRSVANTLGEQADAVTPDVYAAAKRRIGSSFNELTARNSLPVDDGLLGGLVEVQQSAAQLGSDDTARAVAGVIQRVMKQAEDGRLPGRAYQSLDSELGQLLKGGGEKALYLGRIRDVLRGAMDDAISPADREAWQLARQQYRNLKTVRDIVPQDGGDMSPQALSARVRSNQAGKESAAQGKAGELGRLAQIGQRMKEPPSSGTAERLWLLATGAGSMANLPLAVGGLAGANVASRALNSSALARMLMSEGRGQGRQMVAPYLRPAFIPGIGFVPQQGPDDPRQGP